jgi:hypothetical protein
MHFIKYRCQQYPHSLFETFFRYYEHLNNTRKRIHSVHCDISNVICFVTTDLYVTLSCNENSFLVITGVYAAC